MRKIKFEVLQLFLTKMLKIFPYYARIILKFFHIPIMLKIIVTQSAGPYKCVNASNT